MQIILQFQFATLLIACIFAGDKAIVSAQGKDTLRAIVYGIAALLALIVLIFIVFGH